MPFFLSGGTALGLGRGEEIYPLVDLPPHWIVIVRPPFGVSTGEAYAWYDEDRAAGLRETRELQMLPVPWPTRAAQMINDLEPPVVRRHPEIAGLKAALREAGAVAAAMSGSGSAVFGLFRSRAAGRALRQAAVAGRRQGAPDADADPRRARAAGPSRCQAAVRTDTLNLLRTCLRAAPAVACRRAPSGRGNIVQCRSNADGAWPSGKARDFGSRIRRFESSRPNHIAGRTVAREVRLDPGRHSCDRTTTRDQL